MSKVRIEAYGKGYYENHKVCDCEFRDSLKCIRDFVDRNLNFDIREMLFRVYSLDDGKKGEEIYHLDERNFEITRRFRMENSKEELLATLPTSIVQIFNYNEKWGSGYLIGYCEFRDSLKVIDSIIDDCSTTPLDAIIAKDSSILVRTLNSSLIYTYKNKEVTVINSLLMEISKDELLKTIKKGLVEVSYQLSPLTKAEDSFVCDFREVLSKIREVVKDRFNNEDIKKAIFHISTLEDEDGITKEIFYITKTKFVILDNSLMKCDKEELLRDLKEDFVQIEYTYENDPKPTILYSEFRDSLKTIKKEVEKYFKDKDMNTTFHIYTLGSNKERKQIYYVNKEELVTCDKTLMRVSVRELKKTIEGI